MSSDGIGRRRFMEMSGATIIAAGAADLVGCATAPPKPAAQTEGIGYFARFGVTEKMIGDAIAAAMSRGADYADVFLQHEIATTLALQDGAVNRAFNGVTLGVLGCGGRAHWAIIVVTAGSGRPGRSNGRPGGYDQGLWMARSLNDPQFRFIAVSRPGYLRTPLETGRNPEEQGDALAALLDVLRVPQAAVIALSAGGPATFQFALRHQSRCWGVVAISTRTQRHARAPLGLRIMHSVLGCSDAAGWLLSRLFGCMPERTARRKAPLLEGVQTFIPYSLRRAGSSNDLFQLARLPQYPLSEIRTPTLVIHGTADRVVSCSNAEFAANAIPQAQLIRIPGGGHGVFFVQHHWLAPKIVEFLKALRSQLKRKLLIVWDGAAQHKSRIVRKYLDSTQGARFRSI